MKLNVEAGVATGMVQLLELLSELPSTPETVRKEAQEYAGSLEELLPPHPRQPRAGARRRSGIVELDQVPATQIAGLLELLAGMPSTPPSITGEARAHSERLWSALSALDSESA
jgi:hypothetical protein